MNLHYNEVVFRAKLLANYIVLDDLLLNSSQLIFYHKMDSGDYLDSPKPFFERSRDRFENHSFEEEVFLVSYMNLIVIKQLEMILDLK